MQIQGAFTAMITPFRDGKLDETRLRQQIDRQIRLGIDGLVPVGTTGESPTLDFAEHERVIQLTVQYADKKVPVIAGVGANATTEGIHLHRFAKKIGADAGLSVNPYYNRPSQDGLYRHFMTLADTVDLPIVLYNIPSRTGVTMSAPTVARLSHHPNIIAIKESTGDPNLTSEIMSLCNITIISGDDSLALPLISLGAKGIISVLSNLIPDQVKKMTRLALHGNFPEAAAIHHRLFPLTRSLFLDGNPVGIKCAMQLANLDTGALRLPLWEASESTKKLIGELLGNTEIRP